MLGCGCDGKRLSSRRKRSITSYDYPKSLATSSPGPSVDCRVTQSRRNIHQGIAANPHSRHCRGMGRQPERAPAHTDKHTHGTAGIGFLHAQRWFALRRRGQHPAPQRTTCPARLPHPLHGSRHPQHRRGRPPGRLTPLRTPTSEGPLRCRLHPAADAPHPCCSRQPQLFYWSRPAPAGAATPLRPHQAPRPPAPHHPRRAPARYASR